MAGSVITVWYRDEAGRAAHGSTVASLLSLSGLSFEKVKDSRKVGRGKDSWEGRVQNRLGGEEVSH